MFRWSLNLINELAGLVLVYSRLDLGEKIMLSCSKTQHGAVIQNCYRQITLNVSNCFLFYKQMFDATRILKKFWIITQFWVCQVQLWNRSFPHKHENTVFYGISDQTNTAFFDFCYVWFLDQSLILTKEIIVCQR